VPDLREHNGEAGEGTKWRRFYRTRHPSIKCGVCGEHRPYGDAAMWWLIAHDSLFHRWNPYYWIKRRLAGG
jgi:hypothetical protein